MEGINLSQSLQEKQAQARGNFFDKSFYFNLVILLGVLAAYGGAHWYLGQLEKEVSSLDAEIASKLGQLESVEADRVADLRERLDTIGKHLKAIPDPKRQLELVESAMIPEVRLTGYKNDWSDNELMLEGETDAVKRVAQLMLSLKKVPEFSRVAAESLRYNDEGKLEFSLLITRQASPTP